MKGSPEAVKAASAIADAALPSPGAVVASATMEIPGPFPAVTYHPGGGLPGYGEGWQAHDDGAAETDCPFTDEILAEHWLAGYKDAHRAMMDVIGKRLENIFAGRRGRN